VVFVSFGYNLHYDFLSKDIKAENYSVPIVIGIDLDDLKKCANYDIAHK